MPRKSIVFTAANKASVESSPPETPKTIRCILAPVSFFESAPTCIEKISRHLAASERSAGTNG
jgi:hypothetical protein